MLLLAIIFICLAYIVYLGVWAEKLQGRIKTWHIFVLSAQMLIAFQPGSIVLAQANESVKPNKNKAEKEIEERLAFQKIDSLTTSRQFVFKADFGQGSDEIFVVVDSLYAMVQNGNRNSLEVQITQCKVKRNDKRKSISITMMMRGAINTADVFIFIGPSGRGTATIKSDFPGYFSFNGFIVDIKDAGIYEGGSHFVH